MNAQPTPQLTDEQVAMLADDLYDALYAITPYAEPHFANEHKGLENAVRTLLDAAAGQQLLGTSACGPVPDSCDDEPCANHEREQAHAEGEHAFCGAECAAVTEERAL